MPRHFTPGRAPRTYVHSTNGRLAKPVQPTHARAWVTLVQQIADACAHAAQHETTLSVKEYKQIKIFMGKCNTSL